MIKFHKWTVKAFKLLVIAITAIVPALGPMSLALPVLALGNPLEISNVDPVYYQQQYTGDNTVPEYLPSETLYLEWDTVSHSEFDYYALAVGDTPGSITGTLPTGGWFTTQNNSITINNLPQDGRDFYVRIFANNSAGYEVAPTQFGAKTYKFSASTGAIVTVASEIIFPQNGSVLNTESVNVQWQDVGAVSYDLLVGTLQDKAVFATFTGLQSTSKIVESILPTDGTVLYLTVKSHFSNNQVLESESTFSVDIVQPPVVEPPVVTPGVKPLELISPETVYYQQQNIGDNSVPQQLPSTSLSLQWNPVVDTQFDHYALAIGDTIGSISGTLAGSGWFTTKTNSITIENLPEDGRTFYVRIYANKSSGYELDPARFSATAYKFTSHVRNVVPVASQITQPQNNAILSSKNVTVSWQEVDANSYDLLVGTSQNRSQFASYTGLQSVQQLINTNLPTDGSLIFLTLRSHFDNNEVRESTITFTIDIPVIEIPVLVGGDLTGIWANNGEDKVTRDELRYSNDPNSVVNSAWNGQKIQLFGAKNEVVAFNMILEAGNTSAQNVDITFDTLMGPQNYTIGSEAYNGDKNTLFDWTERDIELFYVRYLQIKGVSTLGYAQYDQRHTPLRLQRPHDVRGWGTGYNWLDRPDHDKYYPDIAVPLELEGAFTIASGENQSIWADIYIPKDAPAGIYQGQVRVNQNGNVHFVPVELEVKNFALPDEPASKTMLFISGEPEGQIEARYGYTNSTLVDKHFLMAHRHKISLIDEGAGNDRPKDAWIPRLNGNLFTAQNGYNGPGVGVGNGVYSIGTYGAVAWSWNDNKSFSGSIYDWLDRGELQRHADAWQGWFNQNAPDVERFVYLMDEPGGNYDKLQRWAQDIEQSPGPGSSLMTLVTAGADTGRTQMPSLDISPTTFSVAATDWGSKNTPYYKNDPGKRLFFYNGARPATGSFMTEDDGVALRTIPWTQYKAGIDRWFYWESTYYHNFSGSSQAEGNSPHTNVFQRAQTFGHQTIYDNSTTPEGGRGETGAGQYTPIGNGDGVLFYPGTDVKHPEESYGMNGPIASLRLKYWRRGIQDVDYLTLASAINPQRVNQIVQEIIPKVLWEVGVEEPGASWKHTDISWSVDPDIWEAARLELAQIIESNNPVSPPVEVDSDRDGYSVSNDCNDNNAQINPAATEILYDGIDNDCNPTTLDTVDADQDGYNSELDCNDNNAQINPGAREIFNNGLDDDCSALTPDFLDVVGSQVTSQEPAAGSQNILMGVVPSLNFSEPLDPFTVNYSNIQLRRMLDDTVVYLNSLELNSENTATTFHTTLPLDYGKEYYFAVKNVADLAGNVLPEVWDETNKAEHSFRMESEPVAVPPQEVSPLNLVGEYHFDLDVRDSSGSSHDATLAGNAFVNPVLGRVNGALVLDGSSDYVKVPNSSDTNVGTHAQRTISLWFQAADPQKRQMLYEEGGSSRGLSIYLDAGRLYVGGWNIPTSESGWRGTYLSTANVQPQTWHHVVLTLNGSTVVSQFALSAYLDGALFGQGQGSQLWGHTGGIGVGAVNGDTLLHDGAKSGSGGLSLLGSIDEFMIYNRVLGPEEVLLLSQVTNNGGSLPFEVENDPISKQDLVMQLPFIIEGTYAFDYSGLGNNAELKNGVQIVQNGKYGESASFDGVNDYLHFKDSAAINTGVHGKRTISLTFNPSAVTSRQVLYEEGGTARGLNIYLDNGHLYVGGWNELTTESGWKGTFLDLGVISPGNWYTASLTLNGGATLAQGALKGYVNGDLKASGQGSQLWSHSGDIGVGITNNDTKFHDKNQSGTGTQAFSGYMDDVRVYNRVLSPTEIVTLSSM